MTFTIATAPGRTTLTARCDTCGLHRSGSRAAVAAWQRAHSCRAELLARTHDTASPARRDPAARRDDEPAPRPTGRPVAPIHFRGADTP